MRKNLRIVMVFLGVAMYLVTEEMAEQDFVYGGMDGWTTDKMVSHKLEKKPQ